MRNPEAPGWPTRGERTDLRDVAERWKWRYVALFEQEHRHRVLGIRPSTGLREAAEAYLDHRQATVEPATYSADHTALGHLLRHVTGSRKVESVEVHEMQDMFSGLLDRGYAASTLGTYLKSVRGFFRWYGSYNPAEPVQLPSPGETDVPAWDDEEVARIREAAQAIDQQATRWPSVRLAVELGLSMGLRQSEIFAMHREWVNPRTRTARVQLQTVKDRSTLKPLKGKKARTVHVLPSYWPLHEPGIGLMLPGNEGRPLHTRAQREMITRVLDRAGVNQVGAGWHSLRHTYARLYVAEGGDIQHLQMSLGHASIKTTEQAYGHWRADSSAELFGRRIYGQ